MGLDQRRRQWSAAAPPARDRRDLSHARAEAIDDRIFLPGISDKDRYALWDGEPPASLPRDQVCAYYRAEIAVAQTREDRPGAPHFKLLNNGGTWHITPAECRDMLERDIVREPLAGDLDGSRLAQAVIVWEDLIPLFSHGAEQGGVLAS